MARSPRGAGPQSRGAQCSRIGCIGLRPALRLILVFAGAHFLCQRGPTTFKLRDFFQKHDSSPATSNQIIYTTTDLLHLKLKKGR